MSLFEYGIINVAVAPLRFAPKHRSEQVSQLLFGERITFISAENGAWIRVKNNADDYEGWILRTQVSPLTKREFHKKLIYYSSQPYDYLYDTKTGAFLHLSPGSNLFCMKRNQIQMEDSLLKFKGKRLKVQAAAFSAENLKAYTDLFLGTPYLWGGRSIYGIDCSGLSQLVFKLMGYSLPRDASQQVLKGEPVHFLQDALPGDLAFFGEEDDLITHVGILLDYKTVVHCSEHSGQVVCDAIDSEGIINRKHKIRTHRLRLIKRYF